MEVNRRKHNIISNFAESIKVFIFAAAF